MSKPLAGLPLRQPMQDQNGNLSPTWAAWFQGLYQRVGAVLALTNIELEAKIGEAGGILSALDGRLDALEALPPNQALPSYTVDTLPGAAANVRRMIYVSNEAGGATVAFSDGTNWRRMADRAVVS